MKSLGILIVILVLTACSSSKKVTTKNTFLPNYDTAPFVIVYKTTKDYSQYTPINLNSDKTEIVSYPAPSDILINGELQTPIHLQEGYLLDRRGIGKNVAFLDITYKEYSKYAGTPDSDTLLKHIIDREPLEEMWNCGSVYSFQDIKSQLNSIIKNKQLTIFTQIF